MATVSVENLSRDIGYFLRLEDIDQIEMKVRSAMERYKCGNIININYYCYDSEPFFTVWMWDQSTREISMYSIILDGDSICIDSIDCLPEETPKFTIIVTNICDCNELTTDSCKSEDCCFDKIRSCSKPKDKKRGVIKPKDSKKPRKIKKKEKFIQCCDDKPKKGCCGDKPKKGCCDDKPKKGCCDNKPNKDCCDNGLTRDGKQCCNNDPCYNNPVKCPLPEACDFCEELKQLVGQLGRYACNAQIYVCCDKVTGEPGCEKFKCCFYVRMDRCSYMVDFMKQVYGFRGTEITDNTCSFATRLIEYSLPEVMEFFQFRGIEFFLACLSKIVLRESCNDLTYIDICRNVCGSNLVVSGFRDCIDTNYGWIERIPRVERVSCVKSRAIPITELCCIYQELFQ